MNTTSVAGAVFMLVVGIGFLTAAVIGWRRRDRPSGWPGRVGIAIDVIVGAVALADSAVCVVSEPARVTLWSVGSVVLVVALVLVLVRQHQPDREGPQNVAE